MSDQDHGTIEDLLDDLPTNWVFTIRPYANCDHVAATGHNGLHARHFIAEVRDDKDSIIGICKTFPMPNGQWFNMDFLHGRVLVIGPLKVGEDIEC